MGFELTARADGYADADPVAVLAGGGVEDREVVVHLRRDAGRFGEIVLTVRDETGAPAFPLMLGRGSSGARHESADGRYVLSVPGGKQSIGIRSPTDQVLLFKREWMPSVHGQEGWEPAHAYLPVQIEIEVPLGGRVVREVTVRRAALLWVRQEPKGVFADVRLLNRDGEA